MSALHQTFPLLSVHQYLHKLHLLHHVEEELKIPEECGSMDDPSRLLANSLTNAPSLLAVNDGVGEELKQTFVLVVHSTM